MQKIICVALCLILMPQHLNQHVIWHKQQPAVGNCERLILTIDSKVISNHIKLLERWCKDLDWCQLIALVKIGIRKITRN